MTVWHITFGTYGTRLHGDDRPTVDREHNEFCTPYVAEDSVRWVAERHRMVAPPVLLTREQRLFVAATIPALCERGRWEYLTCAAAPNHVHVLLGADPRVHGKRIRPWLKRWLTAALDSRWQAAKRLDGMSWWAEGGSNRAVKTRDYIEDATRYIKGAAHDTGG